MRRQLFIFLVSVMCFSSQLYGVACYEIFRKQPQPLYQIVFDIYGKASQKPEVLSLKTDPFSLRANEKGDIELQNFVYIMMLITTNPVVKGVKFFESLIHHRRYEEWFNTLYFISTLYVSQKLLFQHDYKRVNPKKVLENAKNLVRRLGVVPDSVAFKLFSDKDLEWVSGKSLNRHFKKHKDEFGVETKEEYVALAKSFLQSVDANYIVVKRESGTYIKYSAIDQIVAIVQNGAITTFYRQVEGYRDRSEFYDYIGSVMLGHRYERNENDFEKPAESETNYPIGNGVFTPQTLKW